jgi:muconolactone delta-isomerase
MWCLSSCVAGLLVSNQTANLLDADQIEEIQANAAEALANITKVGIQQRLWCEYHDIHVFFQRILPVKL